MIGLGIIVRLLARWGVRQARAERLAPWVAGALTFALCAALAGLWLHFHDRAVIQRHEDRALRRIVPALDAAADQRARDTIAISKQEDNAHAEINRSGPDTRPAPAAVAHNCDRLRRAGFGAEQLPLACRPRSGD